MRVHVDPDPDSDPKHWCLEFVRIQIARVRIGTVCRSGSGNMKGIRHDPDPQHWHLQTGVITD
jgi:hypothetical protein